MDGFSDLFSLLLAGYGVFFMYQWFQIKIQKKPVEVKKFMPTDMTIDKCTDVDAFTSFVSPFLLIMGASLVLYAVASYQVGNNPWFIYVVIGYFVVFFITYTLMVRYAKRRFWPDLVKEKKRK